MKCYSFIDLTPPTINCPEPIVAETEFDQAFKEISFDQPRVTDNSITGRDDITVIQEPLHIQSPYEFPIGVTVINFTAIDSSKNSDSCVFRVEIKGYFLLLSCIKYCFKGCFKLQYFLVHSLAC